MKIGGNGGNGGNGTIDTSCNTDEAITELKVKTNGTVKEVQPVCRKLDLKIDEDTTPYTYTVETGGDRNLGTATSTGGTRGAVAESIECPDDTFAIGIAGREGNFIDAIGLVCAPIQLVATGGTDFAIAHGSSTVTSLTQGPGGTAFVPRTCPPGTLLYRMAGKFGSDIDQLTFSCSALAFDTKP